MKAIGTFCQALGVVMVSYSILAPLIQQGGLPLISAGFWFVLGLALVLLQQATLWNLKREKRNG